MFKNNPIMWLSRHSLTNDQHEALRQCFGADVEVIHDSEPFTAQELVERVKAFYKDNFEGTPFVVAPVPMLFELMNNGLTFGYFEMESKRAFEGERPIPIVKAIWMVSQDFRVKEWETEG